MYIHIYAKVLEPLKNACPPACVSCAPPPALISIISARLFSLRPSLRSGPYAAACSWRGETRLVALCALNKAESIVMVIEEGNREAAALVCSTTVHVVGKGYRAQYILDLEVSFVSSRRLVPQDSRQLISLVSA